MPLDDKQGITLSALTVNERVIMDAAAESEWVQLLDEASKSFYYANILTYETSWDAPSSFM